MKYQDVVAPFDEIKTSPKGEQYKVVLIERLSPDDAYWNLGSRVGIRYIKTNKRLNLIFDKFNNLKQKEVVY